MEASELRPDRSLLLVGPFFPRRRPNHPGERAPLPEEIDVEAILGRDGESEDGGGGRKRGGERAHARRGWIRCSQAASTAGDGDPHA